MPTHLTFQQHLAGLHEAMTHFARHAESAGMEADVPPCPGWTVRRLIGHQGAVHRWVGGLLRGETLEWTPLEKQGRSSADPVEWLRDGAIDLVTTLVAADDDTEALVILHDAPPPKRFWARRQCHETTMHAVDALAADLGRLPRAEETWVSPDLALDGVDELVLGFVPRPKMRLRAAEPVRLAVHATDAGCSWTVDVSEEPAVAVRHEGLADGDRLVAAPAQQLYLALWHRSDELAGADLWPLWHDSRVL